MDQRIRLACPCGSLVFGNAIHGHIESCESYKNRPKFRVMGDSTIDPSRGIDELKLYNIRGEVTKHEINGIDQLRNAGE